MATIDYPCYVRCPSCGKSSANSYNNSGGDSEIDRLNAMLPTTIMPRLVWVRCSCGNVYLDP